VTSLLSVPWLGWIQRALCFWEQCNDLWPNDSEPGSLTKFTRFTKGEASWKGLAWLCTQEGEQELELHTRAYVLFLALLLSSEDMLAPASIFFFPPIFASPHLWYWNYCWLFRKKCCGSWVGSQAIPFPMSSTGLALKQTKEPVSVDIMVSKG